MRVTTRSCVAGQAHREFSKKIRKVHARSIVVATTITTYSPTGPGPRDELAGTGAAGTGAEKECFGGSYRAFTDAYVHTALWMRSNVLLLS